MKSDKLEHPSPARCPSDRNVAGSVMMCLCVHLLRVWLSHPRPSSVKGLVYRGCPAKTVLVVRVVVSSRLWCVIHTLLRPDRLCVQVDPRELVHHSWRHLHIRLSAVSSWLKEFGNAFHERFETVVVSRQLDRFINLRVDAHRLLAIRPTVLVVGLVLDVLVCITSCSGRHTDTGLVASMCSGVFVIFSGCRQNRL